MQTVIPKIRSHSTERTHKSPVVESVGSNTEENEANAAYRMGFEENNLKREGRDGGWRTANLTCGGSF